MLSGFCSLQLKHKDINVDACTCICTCICCSSKIHRNTFLRSNWYSTGIPNLDADVCSALLSVNSSSVKISLPGVSCSQKANCVALTSIPSNLSLLLQNSLSGIAVTHQAVIGKKHHGALLKQQKKWMGSKHTQQKEKGSELKTSIAFQKLKVTNIQISLCKGLIILAIKELCKWFHLAREFRRERKRDHSSLAY